MIDETKVETAIDYVLRELPRPAADAFEIELTADPELVDLTKELMEGLGSIGLAAQPVRPRSELFQRVVAALNPRKKSKLISLSFAPWALAACFAAALIILGSADIRTSNEITAIRRRDGLTQLQIDLLRAKVDAYTKVSAIVVWNQQGQTGLLQLNGLPELEPGRDYQVWIVDPTNESPISGVLVPVERENAVRVEFRPERVVTTASKFAISIENSGGSKVPQGPIILIGQ